MWAAFGSYGDGALGPALGEQIAVAVANRNHCEYCLATHTALGRKAGLSSDALADAQTGASDDGRTAALFTFTLKLVEARGQVTSDDVQAVRNQGWTDEHIVEVIGQVALTCSPTTSTSRWPSRSTSRPCHCDPSAEPRRPGPRSRPRAAPLPSRRCRVEPRSSCVDAHAAVAGFRREVGA